MPYVPVGEEKFRAIEAYGPRRDPSAQRVAVLLATCAFATVASLAAMSQPAPAQTSAPQASSSQSPVYVGERWVCRPTDASNPPNGTLTSGGQQLFCHAVDLTLKSSDGRVYVIGKPQADASGGQRVSMTSPDYTAGLSPQQLHDSWVEMVKKGLGVQNASASNGVINAGTRWVCQPADASHPATASVSNSGGTTQLACREVNVALRASTGEMTVIGRVQARPRPKPDTSQTLSSPPYAEGLSVQQMNDSWMAYVNRVFNTATSAAGGG